MVANTTLRIMPQRSHVGPLGPTQHFYGDLPIKSGHSLKFTRHEIMAKVWVAIAPPGRRLIAYARGCGIRPRRTRAMQLDCS